MAVVFFESLLAGWFDFAADVFDDHLSSESRKLSTSQHKSIFGIVRKVRPVGTIRELYEELCD
jgi:hypothetical protein